MDCRDVLVRLWEYLDEELGPEEVAGVAVHLGGCDCCYPAYCCDRALLALLARQRTAGSAPPRLVLSVRALLSAE